VIAAYLGVEDEDVAAVESTLEGITGGAKA